MFVRWNQAHVLCAIAWASGGLTVSAQTTVVPPKSPPGGVELPHVHPRHPQPGGGLPSWSEFLAFVATVAAIALIAFGLYSLLKWIRRIMDQREHRRFMDDQERMLFLNDAGHLQFALFEQVLRCFVPPGHVNAAARSPGREDVKDHLLSPELRNGAGLSIRELRQNDVREGLTGFELDSTSDLARQQNPEHQGAKKTDRNLVLHSTQNVASRTN